MLKRRVPRTRRVAGGVALTGAMQNLIPLANVKLSGGRPGLTRNLLLSASRTISGATRGASISQPGTAAAMQVSGRGIPEQHEDGIYEADADSQGILGLDKLGIDGLDVV